MPVPIAGLEQHYGGSIDEYFEKHDLNDKYLNAINLISEAESLLGRKGSLLDIGAGQGAVVKAAKERGWDTIGIEPSPSFAKFACEYSGAAIKTQKIEECGFEPAVFDVVILAGSLEHLYEPNIVIAEISRILKAGGIVYIDAPNEQGLYFRLGNLYQRMRLRDWSVNLSPTFPPYHVFGFGPRSLKALLRKNKLSPAVWRTYEAATTAPPATSLLSKAERQAAQLVTRVSKHLGMASYIECWAKKQS